MHENRPFLSYRQRRHDAEIVKIMCTYAHYVTLGSRCKMASSHRVTDLENIPVRISKDEAPTPLSVQLGLCLFPPCYFIFLQPCQERGVSVFFVLFTLAFTTGWTSPGSLPFIGCFILFSQFILVCFIICKNEKVLFVLVQQTSNFVASLCQGLGLGQLPVLAIHCFFSWLALLFLVLYRSFTMYE